MTRSTLESALVAAAIAVPPDVLIEIDEDPELSGRRLYGHTWADGSRITLYCDAFEDEEQLLRTLVHELVHVRQVRADGPTTDSVLLARREAEAYAEEQRWWLSYQEQL